MSFQLVGFFQHQPVAGQELNVSAGINGNSVFFVQDTDSGVTYLPVVLDRGFKVAVENRTPLVVALPARIGNGDQWTNVYRECSVVDPALMPSNGGMWEVRSWGIQLFEAFQLPGGNSAPFVVSPSSVAVSEGEQLNTFEVYYREPVTAVSQIDEPQSPLSAMLNARSAGSRGSDVTVTSGAVREGQRIITGVGYKPEAVQLLQARLVSREWMAAQLNAQGLHLWAGDDEDWHVRSAMANYGDLFTGIAQVAN